MTTGTEPDGRAEERHSKRLTKRDQPLPQLRRPRWQPIAALGVFFTAVAFVTRTIDISQTTDLLARGAALADFRDAGYFPVKATLDGVVPYDVTQYFANYPVGQEFPLLPPTYLAVHAPFQLMTLPVAATAMLIVNLVAMVGLTWWALRLSRYRHTVTTVLLVASLLLVSNGARNVVFAGQSTLLFVVGVYLALTSSKETAGAVGVFIALIKPGFGIPLLVFIAAIGWYRRATVGTAATVAVSSIMMIPFVIWAGGFGSLLEILSDNLAFSAESEGISLATTHARVDASATVTALFDVVPSGGVQLAITAAVMGAASAALYTRRSLLRQAPARDAAVVLVCLAMILGTYHSFYDLPLLLLPALLAARHDFAGGGAAPAIRWTILGALAVAAFNPFRVSLVIDALDLSHRSVVFLGTGLTGLAVVIAFTLAVRLVWHLPDPRSV